MCLVNCRSSHDDTSVCLVRVLVLVAVALLAGACWAQDGGAQRKVIIDQDAFGPASSNLQAILMLLQAADVDVLGITIPSGDGWRDEEVSHTLRLLEIAGRTEVAVHPGAVYPLVNTQKRTRVWESCTANCSIKGAWTESWPAGRHRTSLALSCRSVPRAAVPGR